MRKRYKVCFVTLLQSRAMRYGGGHGGTVLVVADFIALLCDALNETQKQIYKGTLYMREQPHRTLLENRKKTHAFYPHRLPIASHIFNRSLYHVCTRHAAERDADGGRTGSDFLLRLEPTNKLSLFPCFFRAIYGCFESI